MMAGHFATALVPYELTRQRSPAPFWLFLLAAQFLDVLMLIFVSVGIETFEPSNFFHAAFVSVKTDMFLSHDILPVLGWAAVFGVIAFALSGSTLVATWCVGLVLVHELCDLVVGFEHFVLGPDSTAVGLSLYSTAPVPAFLLEAAMCLAIVFWFCRRREASGRPVSAQCKWGLYAILVGASLATIPIANQSLASLFGF